MTIYEDTADEEEGLETSIESGTYSDSMYPRARKCHESDFQQALSSIDAREQTAFTWKSPKSSRTSE